jgi:hypothetical protein
MARIIRHGGEEAVKTTARRRSGTSVVRNWRRRVRATFLVVKHHKKYSIFISDQSSQSDEPNV